MYQCTMSDNSPTYTRKEIIAKSLDLKTRLNAELKRHQDAILAIGLETQSLQGACTHKWGAWVTDGYEGYRSRTCTICGVEDQR